MNRVPTIGLLYPGVGAEDDFPRLEQRLAGQLWLPVVTTAGGDVLHTVDTLLGVGSSANLLEGARRVTAYHPDAVIWACTSGSFVYGWAGAQEQVRRIGEDLGLPASSTSLAFAHAVKHLGLSSVAIAASYPEDLARHFRRFLADASIDVVHLGSSGIATAGEVGLMGLGEIARMAVAADRPEAEVVLIPDTAMHSLAWLDELEDAVGKPVLTANQVTVWEGLRIAGLLRNFSGLGSLFRSTEAIRIPAGS